MKHFLQANRSLLMPIGIILGIILYYPLHFLIDAVPFLIFTILLLTYCKMDFRRLRVTRLNIFVIFIHALLSIGAYLISLEIFDPLIAKSVLVGVICPVAASSSAIVVMLGGDREFSIVNTLLDNLFATIAAPILFVIAENSPEISFVQASLTLLVKIFPIIILPLIVSMLLWRVRPRIRNRIAEYEWTTILVWSVALMINFSQTTYAVVHFGSDAWGAIIAMIISSLVMCIIQFALGKSIGYKQRQHIACGQGLGQKNGGLGIWMAYTYFNNPLTTIFIAAYSLWQNVFNSLQLYIHDKKYPAE